MLTVIEQSVAEVDNNLAVNEDSSGCPAIDQLIEASKIYDDGTLKVVDNLEWISYSKFSDIKPIQDFIEPKVYHAVCNQPYGKSVVMLVLMGTKDECTHEFINKFATIYALPTQKHINHPNRKQFQLYSFWISVRNPTMIRGFTMIESNCYMVADKNLHIQFSIYGFCSACGRLRCNPAWCICGHKELACGWTSNCKKLDEFIKKAQMLTKTANDAYLQYNPIALLCQTTPDEFMSVDKNDPRQYAYARFRNRPFSSYVELILLENADLEDDSFYDKLCEDYPDLLDPNVWITWGFTYHPERQKYALVQSKNGMRLCLLCVGRLYPTIKDFCFWCKNLRNPSWSTGNKSLDSFIMASWHNMLQPHDGYLQWIHFSQLIDVHEMPSLAHGCSHVANWPKPITDGSQLIQVFLKKVVNGQDAQSYDFNQLVEKYPKILTPDNIWIIGITQEPVTKDYFLVFYSEIHSILDNVIQVAKLDPEYNISWMQYKDLYEIKEIGSGGYGTVYMAKLRSGSKDKPDQVVALKQLKNFDQTFESFISEIKNYMNCKFKKFLQIYGIARGPETNEYMIVMQYAEGGNLLSFLDHNFNHLTWKMKAKLVKRVAANLEVIHDTGSIHCDLHGGNILLDYISSSEVEAASSKFNFISYVCDLGLSQSVHSAGSKSSTIQGVLPYIAPEVFHTYKHTPKSDIYALGILMHQIASGDPPFRNRAFDYKLMEDICNGLRPYMPDSAPEPYKKLAKECCDAEPNNRPSAGKIKKDIQKLVSKRYQQESAIWNIVYKRESVDPISRIEKENKYSSKLLTTESLPTPRNSCNSNISDSKQIELVLPDEFTSLNI